MTTNFTDPVLYRFFDATNKLLYVGITISGPDRFKAHRHAAPWWKEATTITLERFSDLQELAAAERRAIENESPKYNITYALPRDQTRPKNIRTGHTSPDANRFAVEQVPPAYDDKPLFMVLSTPCPYCAGRVRRQLNQDCQPTTDPTCSSCNKCWSIERFNHITGAAAFGAQRSP